MANNIGYLTSKLTPEHQEMYTPYYAVEPIVKYKPVPNINIIRGGPQIKSFKALIN